MRWLSETTLALCALSAACGGAEVSNADVGRPDGGSIDSGSAPVIPASRMSSVPSPCGAPDAGTASTLFTLESANDVADWSAGPDCTAADGGCPGITFVSSRSLLTFDPTMGDPTAGAMELAIPFDNFNEEATFHHVFACPVDGSGSTLSVHLRFDSGFGQAPTDPAGFIVIVKTGADNAGASSVYRNVLPSDDGTWIDTELSLSSPPYSTAGYDPTQVSAIDLCFYTGAAPVAAQPSVPLPEAATIHVDIASP